MTKLAFLLGRVRISVDPASCAPGGAITPPRSAGCTAGPGQAGFAYVAAYPN